MSESETSRDGRARATPLEIDSGTRFKIMDAQTLTTYAHIYCATGSSPTGFNKGTVYYHVVTAFPTSTSTIRLKLHVDTGVDDPGFPASEAVAASAAGFQSQSGTPSASGSLWVHNTGNFAVAWDVTGTLSGARGRAGWWHGSTRNITPSEGDHTLANWTPVNLTYLDTDTLG